MKTFIPLIIVITFLVSCSRAQVTPSVSILQTALAETQAAIPNYTPTIAPSLTPIPSSTPVQLDQIDLAEIAIQPGDLPAGFSGAQIRKQPPAMFDGIPTAINTLYQQFEYKQDISGGVSIFLYSKEKDEADAFDFVKKSMGDFKITNDVGDEAIYTQISNSFPGLPEFDAIDLAFIRCSAVVHIRFGDLSDLDSAIGYATRLDERLKSLVCN